MKVSNNFYIFVFISYNLLVKMGVKLLDNSELINKFLFSKKESGVSHEKIKIYLNLLKFFTENLEKKGLSPLELENPVDTVMQIKFDGLDPGSQQEYFQLFLDFIGFCRKGGKETAVVLPKEGGASKKKPAPLITVEAKVSKPFKSIALIAFAAVLISVAVILLTGRQDENQVKGQLRLELIMDKAELKSYADSTKGYLSDLMSVIRSWEKISSSSSSWGQEHEMLLINMGLLLDRINKVEPPKLLLSYHKKLIELNQQIDEELINAKKDLSSSEVVSGGVSRKERTFNSVNILMKQFEEYRRSFISSINSACEFNSANCKL